MQQFESLNNDDRGRIDPSLKKLLRDARSLLGQMTSHNTSETANRVTALINQAGSESSKNLWDGIIGLIFRRATRDAINPVETTKLCAQLCRHLVQASSNQGLNSFPQEDWLNQEISWLCGNSLPPSGGSEPLVQNLASTIPESVQRLQGSTRSDGANSEYPPADRTTFFVGDLYRENVLTASQVHEFIERLLISGASKEECASGLCALMEQHGQTLDSDPWKDAMDSAFRWIEIAIAEYLAGKHVATRLEGIIRLRSQSWGVDQIAEWTTKNVGDGDPSALELRARRVLKAKAEAEAAAAAQVKVRTDAELAAAEATSEARDTVSPVDSPKPTSSGLLPSTIPERPSPLSVSTTVPTTSNRPKRPIPGPLELVSAQDSRKVGFSSALTSARFIEDLNAVNYPEAIGTPNSALSFAVEPRKFRYDRGFLLKFMDVCKEKPESLAPLHILGLEPGEAGATPSYPGGARASGRRVNLTSGTPGKARQNSVGLGLGNTSLAKGGFPMGSFQARPSPLGDSQSRFEASSPGAQGLGGVPFSPGATGRLTPMTRGASQGGVEGPGGPREAKRTRSQRGNNRKDSMRQSGSQTSVSQMASLEPVAPLAPSENRWVAGSMQKVPQSIEAHTLVERKVKSLLNKLTMDNFDSISDQIIEYANKSENERNGATFMQVVKLVFESAKNGTGFSEMYARLCQTIVEGVSPSIQDEKIRSPDGRLITGGTLFRKYLLEQCEEDFERGWSVKEAIAALVASKAGDDKAIVRSDEYYAAAKAKRQGLGLVRFVGELFKLQMLTERVMHECIKKFLLNVVNPKEEEIESLCVLLTTVGRSVDNTKAGNHMDIYFERMQEMTKSSSISSRIQFMLQDIIELRARHWQARAHSAPSTGAGQQSSGRDNGSRNTVQRGGSRRGEHRGDHGPQADGWNFAGDTSAARPPAKAGDLSQFGKISKPANTLSFGPTSQFSKKNPKREGGLSQASGSTSMPSALSAAGSNGPPPTEPAARSAGSLKPSIDLGPGGAVSRDTADKGHRPISGFVKPASQSKASNPSAWSKGTPQASSGSNSSRAQSPASKAVKAVTVSRGIASTGHRPTSSISFGSVDSPSVSTPPAPASTSTPGPKRAVNIHALFQGGGGATLSTSPRPHPHPHPHPHAPTSISANLFTPSSASSLATAQLISTTAPFVPGAIRRRAAIRISTPDGNALTFGGAVPPSPKVTIGMGQGPPPGSVPGVGGLHRKRPSMAVRMETAEEKKAREEKEWERKEKEEREKKEGKERLE